MSGIDVEQLAITDLVDSDLARIGWSGTALHVQHVATELERVARGDADYLAARTPDGAPIAKGGIDYTTFPGAGVIHQLATRADAQGLGIGTRLIAAAEDRIRRRGLNTAIVSVEADNPRARELYERLGYVERGERVASWDAQRDDGSTYRYEATLTDLEKVLMAALVTRLTKASGAAVDDINALLPQLKPAWPPITLESLTGLLDSPTRVYVARVDAAIVGLTLMVPHRHFPGLRCHIEDVVVDAAHRRRGIARQLLEYAMADAPADTLSFDLRSHAVRTGAHELYTSLGFEAGDSTVFRRLF